MHVPIPPKYGHHVATLHLRSHTSSLSSLTFFTSFALRSARALGLPTSNVISLPTVTSLYTVPRSPFAHKKSQENFWKKEHKRAIKVYDGDGEVVRAWLAYLRKEAMGGVGMKAQLMERREVGWGKRLVGSVEEGLRKSVLMQQQQQQEEQEGGAAEAGERHGQVIGGGEMENERQGTRESIKSLSDVLVEEFTKNIEAAEGIEAEAKNEAEHEVKVAAEAVVEEVVEQVDGGALDEEPVVVVVVDGETK